MTISQANMRISAVDGTAFVDFSAVGLLTANIGKRLTVLDSTGKKLIGFIKAAGTGETYSENIVNGDMEINDNWIINGTPTTFEQSAEQAQSPTNSWKVVNDAAYEGIRQINTGGFVDNIVAGNLISVSVAAYPTSALRTIRLANNGGGHILILSGSLAANSWNTVSTYANASIGMANGFLIQILQSGVTIYFDDVSCKKVLTPSATGVTIVSTLGGAIFNWKSKEAGFNYNDPAGYEYLITNQRAIFSNYYRQMRAA